MLWRSISHVTHYTAAQKKVPATSPCSKQTKTVYVGNKFGNCRSCVSILTVLQNCDKKFTTYQINHPSDNCDTEALLQIKLDAEERTLLGSTSNGFVIWNLGSEGFVENDAAVETFNRMVSQKEAVVLPLPHGVRNISTKILESNSIMLDSTKQYAVAGVR